LRALLSQVLVDGAMIYVKGCDPAPSRSAIPAERPSMTLNVPSSWEPRHGVVYFGKFEPGPIKIGFTAGRSINRIADCDRTCPREKSPRVRHRVHIPGQLGALVERMMRRERSRWCARWIGEVASGRVRRNNLSKPHQLRRPFGCETSRLSRYATVSLGGLNTWRG